MMGFFVRLGLPCIDLRLDVRQFVQRDGRNQGLPFRAQCLICSISGVHLILVIKCDIGR